MSSMETTRGHDSAANESVAKATRPRAGLPSVAHRLEVIVEREDGRPSGRVCLLEGDVLRVGSHESNELVLRDPMVSRFHFQLRVRDAGVTLIDIGSLNGTLLGGYAVRDAELRLPESRIEVGSCTLLVRAVAQRRESSLSPPMFGAMFGSAPAMLRLFERVTKVAAADQGAVLIEGESGTGKELLAAEVARRSKRRGKPFVIVDCGAVAPTLMESELFGHCRGAFTGATTDRKGAFEAADGGILFLDEIGELPLEMQPKLLRALATGEVKRVGENQVRRTDVRIIAATNRCLDKQVNEGRFREDLFYRLSVLRLDVPPLRERVVDLPLLVGCFLEQLGATDKHGLFDETVMRRLETYAWPGNVRELRNYVERAVVFEEHPPQTNAAASSEAPARIDLTVPFREAKEAAIRTFETNYLSALLAESNGNVSRAARKAKTDRMYLHRLLQRYGLKDSGSLE
jgi:transcriptional regulator with GAF, ATPase, and Fis domain